MVLLASVTGLWAAPPQSDAPDTEVRVIIDKALERASWAAEQTYEASYRHQLTQRTRRFAEDGEVTDEEKRLYRVESVAGVPYARLVSKDGGPIEGDELNTERTRWHAFLEELDQDSDGQNEVTQEDDSIDFNAELIGRYTVELEGIRELRGRPTYVLSFEPRPGRLPVRRHIDHALNKSRGEIWVDQATYEIARVSFQLTERVRLWWGILGSISKATGHLEREPITESAWLATELDIYFHVRVLFRTTRRGQTTHWDQYELVSERRQQRAPAGQFPNTRHRQLHLAVEALR